MLTKDHLDTKTLIEARKMRTKAIEQIKVDSELQKFLNKPNRYQSGAMFREQLYGFKLLTGEGNAWFTRLDKGKRPEEMLIIPKSNIALVKGIDAWDIMGYEILFGVNRTKASKEDVVMWKFPNYEFSESDLRHLRGQSPLDAGLLQIQASNEADERRVAMNKNQGVAGLVFNESDTSPKDWSNQSTINQAMFQRKQVNSIVNDKELAGSIAVMMGKWGYHQFGLDAGQLKLLEQTDITMEALCNIFDVPPGMFTKNQTWENRKEQKREFIYDNIAVAAYGLRDEWNAKLVPEFNLDRERDVIDCDILSLPELAEDLKTQAEAVGKLWQLTPNEVREYIGYDKLNDKNMDKVYVQGGVRTLEDVNDPIGDPLPDESNL
jgi:HK97 family phage portal protein